ncbi:serine/threonine protein kinase [Telmatocola sphagniphila]|uniref:Serine/threonine protein kinase n=1 Tax=Telmatocola sphagniphila TaxID=1123043 RepID=A0A8E6EZY9_9BACT|nr:serine/threonine-protein kinase [Telmatocola sphagniphila]QVL33971.1 serine/threonine protein kinase [Telmatocola sphagniphila]
MTEEALFLAALEKNSPIERQAFLDEACGADTLLRARVQLLLEADARVRGILDRPEPGDPEETGAYLPKEQSGTIIAGRYKLLEPIGEGGMGTVWVAEQTQPVRRKVALKLIKAGMDSKSVLARFEGERQALALMDHPNIAKVLDGGLTETGRPYFVMEYIKGIRITEFCDTARLSIPERLQLFAQVCQAVQHAHHKGIIHRDLKPSNILVAPYDDKPVPKIIDFGLAKAMHQSLTERTLHTAHETVLGTPLYMSPEQAQLNNLDVDTRSDIYSLGVLLYKLLTGTTPLEKNRFKEAAWEEIRRLIREEEPPRPSTRLSSTNTLPSLAAGRQTDPAHLKKLMRGELDWIVMKSLEKDRSRRYETANGFALDIQRYLAGEPVLAVPPSRSYRLRKFVRKNRVALTTASVITSLVVAGVMGVLVVKLQANRDLTAKNTELVAEQVKVEKRFELAQKAIAKLHSGVGEDLLLKSGQFKELRNQLLKEAGEFYGDMEKLLEGEVDPKSRSLLADGYFQLADLTDQIGSKPKALALHRKALEMRRNLAAAPGSDLKTQLNVARSLGAVGYILLFTGDLDGAMLNFREQHDTAAALAKDSPTEAVQVVVAQSLTRFAMVHRSKQRPSEASTETDMAAAILRKLSKVNPTSEELQQELARTLEQSGKLLWEAGKWQPALANHDNAHVIWNKLASTHSDISRYQYSLGISDYYIGDTLLDVGKPAQALPSLRKAAAIAKNLADTYPAVTKFQIMLAFIQRDIGSALSDMGRSAEAKEALLQVMENCERIDKSDSSLVTVREPLESFFLSFALFAQTFCVFY